MKLIPSIYLLLSTTLVVSGGNRIVNAHDFVINPDILKSATLHKRDLPPQPIIFQDFPTPQVIENMPNGEAPQQGPTLLRTQLAVNRDISIFASYVRDFASLEARFNDNNEFSLVLAPSNFAISSLSLKPWEFPTPVNNDHSTPEEEKDRIARHNIMSFIAHHLNLIRSDNQNDELKKKLIISEEDNEFHLITESGNDIIVNRNAANKLFTVKSGDITVNVKSTKQVDNGVIWVLDESLARP